MNLWNRKIKINIPLSINFNIKKGSGIREYTLKQISEIMKISKQEIVNSIRDNKNYSIEELLNIYKEKDKYLI